MKRLFEKEKIKNSKDVKMTNSMFFTSEPAETTNTKCIKPKRMDKKKNLSRSRVCPSKGLCETQRWNRCLAAAKLKK